MQLDVKAVEYFNFDVRENVADGSALLATIAGAGVDFLAYKATLLPDGRTRFTLFPEDSGVLASGAASAGLALDGPHFAVYVRDEESPGALSRIYERLAAAGIAVQESAGMAHVNGAYGVVLYLAAADCARAVEALA